MAIRPEEPTLKSDPFAQLTLLDLQGLDSTLAQLVHRKETLPEQATVEEQSTRRKGLESKRVDARTQVADLTRDQKKSDAEVEQVRTRRTRNELRMASGQVTSPKDLESLQHEVTALDRRITTLEDEELEVMESLEQAQAELDAVLAGITEVDAQLAEAEAARDAVVSEIDDAAGETLAEREITAAKVPEPLLTLYDKVRAHRSGLGAAALRQGRCEGCRLELNGADLREIAAQPSDEVLRCPECDRILVRTLESAT